MFKKSLTIFSIFLLFILSIGMVSASENMNQSQNEDFEILTNKNGGDVKIDEENIKESKLVNSKDTIKTINKTKTTIKTKVSTKKSTQVLIKTKNLNTYQDSDTFFTAKILNKTNKKPIKGLKVLFTLYSDKNKHSNYYRITNKKGVATLNKNLKIGNYSVYTSVKQKNIISPQIKSKIKIKPTAETGCCSFYIHLNSTESIGGFRRDSTYATYLYIKPSKWHYNKKIIKQYKLRNNYFFHLITTSDGWIMGTGGADNPRINKAIEKIGAKMTHLGKIKISYLKKIRTYERRLGIGHFAIKAPNGRFAIVWKSKIKTGKLKNGEYISVPNEIYSFRRGTYKKFNKNPVKAAIKIGATDRFGFNRRDCTIFHLKDFKVNPSVTVYAANDNGRLSGRRTAHLIDDIRFKNKHINKYTLPKTPNMKLLGTHNFGSNLIKTIVSAPNIISNYNESKVFKITINDKTKKAIQNISIKLKINGTDLLKTYYLKTNKYGVATFNTNSLNKGIYDVIINSNNKKYIISTKSKIEIK